MEQEKEGKGAVERDQVVKLIHSVVSKVETNENLSKEILFQELKTLTKIIDKARKDMGAARAGDISQKHIPTATDELDAIVEATAVATSGIMDACEAIQNHADELEDDKKNAISDEVMKIYEECSFQDITGQRITKVVQTLKAIEEKVDHLLNVIVEKMPGIEQAEGEEEDKREGDARLLNGPQLPGQGVTQEDIDSLLDDLF